MRLTQDDPAGTFRLERRFDVRTVVAALFLSLGVAAMIPSGPLEQPANVVWFLAAAAVMGLGYVCIWPLKEISTGWFWVMAVVWRLALLAVAPGDDIWRYLWEGGIQRQGFNPYAFPPDHPALMALRTPWWTLINHPDLPTVYPPLAELIFRGVAAVSVTPVFFKAVYALADLGICLLLARRFGCGPAALYAWNPLVLYCFAGGGHYDSLFILPLVMAWLMWDRKRDEGAAAPYLATALLVGVSVALKWVSLPLLAWPCLHALRARRLPVAVAAGVVGLLPLGLSILPFLRGWRPTWGWMVDYCQGSRGAELLPCLVGPFCPPGFHLAYVLGAILAVIVLALCWWGRSAARSWENYFAALMILSAATHAWYFTWLIPFAVASRNLGIRLGSLSFFVYFWLKYTAGTGQGAWVQSGWEKALMWLPFLLGWAWWKLRRRDGVVG